MHAASALNSTVCQRLSHHRQLSHRTPCQPFSVYIAEACKGGRHSSKNGRTGRRRVALACCQSSDTTTLETVRHLSGDITHAGNDTSSSNIVRISAAAAAAARPRSSDNQSDVHQLEQQFQSSRQQITHLSGSQKQMWVPERELWVPGGTLGHGSSISTNAVGSSTAAGSSSSSSLRAVSQLSRTLGGSTASTSVHLSRVFMSSAATQGQKQVMEDRHVLAALDPKHGVQPVQGAVGLQQQVSLAGVFDGHAGHATAAYAAKHIPHLLHSALSGRSASVAGAGPVVPARKLLAPPCALSASFRWFDRWWADARCDPTYTPHGWDESGSTAVVGLVSGQQLVVANAGDSVALLAHGGAAQRLTVEHRLNNEAEAERVVEAGGRLVAFKPGAAPRIMGNSTQTRFKGSMVTRSLGDFAFKHPQPLISAEPAVCSQLLQPCDKLVVLTSDGVTDVLPDDDMLEIGCRAIEQARACTNNGCALAKAAAAAIMDKALEHGSTDNITVVTMLLDWGCEYASE